MGSVPPGPALALLLFGLAPSLAGAFPRPDLENALHTLIDAPFALAGNGVGAAGLMGAAALGLAGDAASLLDESRLGRPLLRGAASSALHRSALAVSWTATGALEGLRGEEIERLPEALPTYLQAAPGVGRLDTFLGGLAALNLAVRDLLRAPAQTLLYATGAREQAARLARKGQEDRTRLLGPPPLEPAAAP